MEKEFSDQIRSIGDHMIALRHQEAERIQQEKLYEAARNEAEAKYAQEFHLGPPTPLMMAPGAVYYAPPLLRLDHTIHLHFKEDRWNHGCAQITGPGSHPWFHTAPAKCTMWNVEHDRQWCIANMRDDSLIFLEEANKGTTLKFRIFRQLQEPSRHSPPVMQKMCSVKRIPSGYYTIKMGGGKKQRSTTLVRCEGNWLESDFTFWVQGVPGVAATVSKKFFTATDQYAIEVAANQDILFFVALTVCIDRMHHKDNHDDDGDHYPGAGNKGANTGARGIGSGAGGSGGGSGLAFAAGALVGSAISSFRGGSGSSSHGHHGGHHHHHHGHHGGHHHHHHH